MLRMGRLEVLLLGAAMVHSTALWAAGQAKARVQLPDAPGKDTVQKICAACHGVEVIVPRGMTRQEWSQVVANMVAKGAKGTDEEFAQVLDYLAANFPPTKVAAPGASAGAQAIRTPGAPTRGAGLLAAGPDGKQVVDEAAAGRGKTLYNAECGSCHGALARGGANGPDLVRSVLVLHDRYGSTLGPFLAKGHPMASGGKSHSLTQAQVEDLSHFLHQQVNDTLRSGPYSKVINVLTGDAAAGEAYFNGAGKCSTCHSVTGDLAHVASKYDPATLQERVVFPQTVGFGRRGRGVARSKPVMVTVTPASGPAVTGALLSLDDFSVSLRDANGDYHDWQRTPDLKVEKHDPYAGHIALLDEYTDKNIHDVVAYLETLK